MRRVALAPKITALLRLPNVKLRGAPTLKPEQRAYLDETQHLAMPRQGVSLLNDMLDLGRTPHKTHTRPKTLEDNVIFWMMPVKRYP